MGSPQDEFEMEGCNRDKSAEVNQHTSITPEVIFTQAEPTAGNFIQNSSNLNQPDIPD